MSYSCSDFAEHAALNADAYGLPEVPRGRLGGMGIDPESLAPDVSDEDAKLAVLAERIACAMSDYEPFREALEGIVKCGAPAAAIARAALLASSFNPQPGEDE